MAQTTTSINACDVVVKLDNNSNSLVDISGSSNDVSIDMSNDVGKTSTFGSRWKISKNCKSEASISLKAVYSTADQEAVDLLKDWYFNSPGTSRTIQINVPDGEIGSDQYYGEMTLESLNIPLTSDDAAPIMVSASLSNDGPFYLETIAS